MNDFYALFHNYVLNAAAIAWLTAQVLKTILALITTRRFVPERLVGSGGMPSSHSATVCALMVAVSRHSGFYSPEFAIACVLAAVVMYDAMGVRRAAGEHAKAINMMTREWDSKNASEDDKKESEEPAKELKEFLGHTPLEVLGGALLGIIIAMLLPIR